MGWGSGIRKKPIPDPGVKKAPDPRSGSATLLSCIRISKTGPDLDDMKKAKITARQPFLFCCCCLIRDQDL